MGRLRGDAPHELQDGSGQEIHGGFGGRNPPVTSHMSAWYLLRFGRFCVGSVGRILELDQTGMLQKGNRSALSSSLLQTLSKRFDLSMGMY
jgi:hypothetical protein